jgi:pimeloyl-ACP methyl ester carboxylesterase
LSTFVLVHGAFHGAWCWDLVRPDLEAAGHAVIAIDLPCDDPSAGNVRYAEVVSEDLGSAGDVILVGHSLGGLTIPLVAASRTVRQLVFLNAFIPIPGQPFRAQFGEEGICPPSPEETWPVTGHDGLMRWPAERVIPALYADCEPELARWAAARLRPQSGTPHSEVCQMPSWPEVSSSYILSTEDGAVGPAWSRRAARDRLGTTALELPGGHMSMVGHPKELVRELLKVASM